MQKRKSIDAAEAKGGCGGDDCCDTLRAKADLWYNNARDRWNYDSNCRDGGDDGHINIQKAAYRAWRQCEKLLKKMDVRSKKKLFRRKNILPNIGSLQWLKIKNLLQIF
jgi:hypothetical protein